MSYYPSRVRLCLPLHQEANVSTCLDFLFSNIGNSILPFCAWPPQSSSSCPFQHFNLSGQVPFAKMETEQHFPRHHLPSVLVLTIRKNQMINMNASSYFLFVTVATWHKVYPGWTRVHWIFLWYYLPQEQVPWIFLRHGLAIFVVILLITDSNE